MYRREKHMCKVCRYRFHEVDFDTHPLFGKNIFTTARNILDIMGELQSKMKSIEVVLANIRRAG